MRKIFCVTLILGAFAPNTIAKDVGTSPDWPQWRGPNNTGVGAGDRIPDAWSATKNVRWKKAIPGQGHGTPTITGDRVFLLTAVALDEKGEPAKVAPAEREPDRRRSGRGGRGGGRPRNVPPTHVHRFVVMCLDRKTGDTRWQQTAIETLPHEGHHRRYGSFASASAAIDGNRVYVSFGSDGVYCYDLDGKRQWKRDLGKMNIRNGFGEGSSPVVHGDLVIIPFDHEGDSFLIALDKHDGKTRWKTARSTRSAWSTPVVAEANGKLQIIANGNPAVRGYDFATGKELWHCDGMTHNVIPAIVYGHGMVFAASGFRGNALRAIRLGRTGDLSDDPKAVVWQLDRGTPYVTSPLLYGDELFLLEDRGLVSCYDARTGKPHYVRQRLPDISQARFHASPVGAGGKIYLVNETGDCVVLKRGTELEVLAVNRIDESFSASPALAGGDLFLRGSEHLYCIGTE